MSAATNTVFACAQKNHIVPDFDYIVTGVLY